MCKPLSLALVLLAGTLQLSACEAANASREAAATRPATQHAMRLWAKAVSHEQIDTSWDSVKGAIEYRIELSHDGHDFFDSVTMEASESRCSNADLFPDKQHFFRVTALGPDEKVLGVSNVASARTLPDPRADQPALIPATQAVDMRLWAKVVSHRQIDLWWDTVRGADAYRIETSRDGKRFTEAQKLSAPEARWSSSDLAPDQDYWFRVTALTSDGQPLKVSKVARAHTLRGP